MKKKAVSYTKSVVIGAVMCVLILIYETKKNTSCHKEPQIYRKERREKKSKEKVSRREKKKKMMRNDEAARRRLRFAPDRLRSCRRPPFRETSACPRR